MLDWAVPAAPRPFLSRLAGTLVAMAWLCLLVSGPAASGQDAPEPTAGCGTDIPVIKVTTEIAEIAYDHSLPIAVLNRANGRGEAASGHVLGLTRQLYTGSIPAIGIVIRPQPEGGFCVGYDDGTMVLRLQTDIFIGSELEAGSCLYDQVLAHEQRHAKVGQRLYREFAAKLEAGLEAALRKQPFIRVASEAEAAGAARARLTEIYDPLYRDFRSVYRKRQAIIDTSGEFERVRAACPGEAARLMGQ